MSADDLWCSWCRQPHAPCATTPAMEAERAATLRARLQERYERPERPCTYDPADEEPEGDWTPPRPEPLEYSGIPVVVDPEQEEGTVRLVSFDPMVTRYPSDIFAPVAPPMTPMTPESTARRDAERAHFAKRYPEIMAEVLGTGPDRVAYGTTHLAPTVTPPRDHTAREANVIAESIGWPKADTTDARADEIRRHPLTGTSTWGTLTLPPGGDAFEVKPDGTPHTCPTVDTSRDAMRVEALRRPFEFRESSISLRSYLRALTNPDATPEEVDAALDALTPGDRALVSEALPSWGSARMSRVEAIAPFMDRFETMVRERDPRANEEGTLLLSALREDDPTRSTIETLMEIAKTPKVNP